MKVQITEYKPIKKEYMMEMPTEKIAVWIEDIPEQRSINGYISNFMAADYVHKKYPYKSVGVIIL